MLNSNNKTPQQQLLTVNAIGNSNNDNVADNKNTTIPASSNMPPHRRRSSANYTQNQNSNYIPPGYNSPPRKISKQVQLPEIAILQGSGIPGYNNNTRLSGVASNHPDSPKEKRMSMTHTGQFNSTLATTAASSNLGFFNCLNHFFKFFRKSGIKGE